MGSSVCEPEFKVIIFLPCKICGNEKYAVAVDYQILDQKLTGPPVTTQRNIKFGQFFSKLLINYTLLHQHVLFTGII